MNAENKIRSDAWYSTLTDDERWTLYDKFKFGGNWDSVAKYAAAEYALPKPSRSAVYRFYDAMRPLESERRLSLMLTAREEGEKVAQAAGIKDGVLVNMFSTFAADAVLRKNDIDGAKKLTHMASQIAARMLKEKDLELKKQSQKTKDKTLELMEKKYEATQAQINATANAVKQLSESGGLSAEARAEIEKAMGLL